MDPNLEPKHDSQTIILIVFSLILSFLTFFHQATNVYWSKDLKHCSCYAVYSVAKIKKNKPWQCKIPRSIKSAVQYRFKISHRNSYQTKNTWQEVKKKSILVLGRAHHTANNRFCITWFNTIYVEITPRVPRIEQSRSSKILQSLEQFLFQIRSVNP